MEAEGGCGVTGFACSVPVRGKHIYEPSLHMRNRGNGKGGGIAAVGLVPKDFGVSRQVLDDDYLIQIALLDPDSRADVEREFIQPNFNIDQAAMAPTVDDFHDVELLEVKPPDIQYYFVRVKPDVLERFVEENKLQHLSEREAEDEFIYQNSVRLNNRFYASLGKQQAFVLSHGRNMIVRKIVGYAEQVVQYYKMENMCAHAWIAHQRYPTKGRVWHPGGAHPFVGLNEALVHNGDFANYHSVSEYLLQRNIRPQFLTDTEVSVMLFDLWNRVYGYPVECIIEAMAPTTELDFDRLPEEKQRIYRQIQASHIHGSPDGPWFFIIARNLPETNQFQLLGITDTAMLRPQVFAIQEGEVSIGLICSEKQAIDATLHSLSQEDPRFCTIADRYWNARGGSFNDGGAFMFTLNRNGDGENIGEFVCTDKFGTVVTTKDGQKPCDIKADVQSPGRADELSERVEALLESGDSQGLFALWLESVGEPGYDRLRWLASAIADSATTDDGRKTAIEAMTLAIDRRYDTLDKKRSWVLHVLHGALYRLLDAVPSLSEEGASRYRRINLKSRDTLRDPVPGEQVLIIDGRGFPPEGFDNDAALLVAAYKRGWKRFISYNTRGQRFHGVGLGPNSRGVRVDLYGNPGDYIASGMDGVEIHIHCNAQDQLGQIAKLGKLVIHGDVGQTFLYGAKGGEIFVLGNAAGRPLINAVGRPRVVINGTCLDFLAESFMAGNPHEGGGFVILNGMIYDDHGNLIEQALPYPGSNLFSLASGGAIFVRDPHRRLVDEQLNGGKYAELTAADWRLILPYLEENERLFGVSINDDLLVVDGERKEPRDVYRKVVPYMSEEMEAEFEALGE